MPLEVKQSGSDCERLLTTFYCIGLWRVEIASHWPGEIFSDDSNIGGEWRAQSWAQQHLVPSSWAVGNWELTAGDEIWFGQTTGEQLDGCLIVLLASVVGQWLLGSLGPLPDWVALLLWLQPSPYGVSVNFTPPLFFWLDDGHLPNFLLPRSHVGSITSPLSGSDWDWNFRAAQGQVWGANRFFGVRRCVTPMCSWIGGRRHLHHSGLQERLLMAW